MKYNLSDILNNMDVEETEAIVDHININYNETIAQRIKERVITEENVKEKHSKAKRLSFKTIIAFAAVFLILLTSITVGATAYFVPDNNIVKLLNFTDAADLSTMGQDVNCVSESNGYEIKLTQVIGDNTTIYLVFESPKVNGYTISPNPENQLELRINGIKVTYFGYGIQEKDGTFYVSLDGLKYIMNNSKFKISVNGMFYYDEEKDQPVEIEGKWDFEFNYKRVDVQRKIDTDAIYSYYGASTYQITDLRLSPLGIYIKGIEVDFDEFSKEKVEKDSKDLMMNSGNNIIIKMKDGTVYTDNDTEFVSSGWGKRGNAKAKSDLEVYFTNIVNVDDIESIIIGGYVIYEA